MPYPTPPGERLAYDLDGTVGFVFQNTGLQRGSLVQLSDPAMRALNADAGWCLHIQGDSQQFEAISTGTGIWNMIPQGSGFAGSYYMPGPLQSTPVFVALLFPQPMRIRGMFAANALIRGYSAASSSSFYTRFPMNLELSSDTTNGQDGTWHIAVLNVYGPGYGTTGFPPNSFQAVNPDGSLFNEGGSRVRLGTGAVFRNLAALDGANGGIHAVEGGMTRQVRGARLVFANNPEKVPGSPYENETGSLDMFNVGRYLRDAWINFHLYGEPDTDATDDKLAFITTAGAPMNFDLGDVYGGQTIVKQFKLRNLSDQDALNIDLSFVGPNPTPTPSPHVTMEFSQNGTTYSSSLMLNSLAAGADSGTLYARTVVPNGLVGPWGPHILAEVGEWS